MAMEPQTRTGNLKSALSNFNAKGSQGTTIEDQSHPSANASGRDRLLTFGSITDINGRDRSLTFGSDFDFSFSNHDNFNSLLAADLNSSSQTANKNVDDEHGDGVNPVSVDTSTTSTTPTALPPAPNAMFGQSNDIIAKPVNIQEVMKCTGLTKPIIPKKSQSRNIGDSGSGGSNNSGFLDGMFIQNYNGNRTQPMIAHTPPSALGTSYEAQHFGKRMRAGSISGRLRSVSNLEDMEIIDKQQKTMIKDLIIAGDKDLLNALDDYENGDTSQLEKLVKKGLENKAQDLDLLDDLDLDFLTFNEGGAAARSRNTSQTGEGDANVTNKSTRSSKLRSSFIYVKNALDGNEKDTAAGAQQGSYEDDGIGELDFNDDYGGADYLDVLANSGTSNNVTTTDGGRTIISDSQNIHRSNQGQSQSQPLQSNSSLSTLDTNQRNRSNTFSSLLAETPPTTESQQNNFGRWMDGPVSIGSLENLTTKYLLDSDNLSLTDDLRNIIVTPEIVQLGEDERIDASNSNDMETESSKPSRAKSKKVKEKKPKGEKKTSKKDGKSSKKDEKNKSKDSQGSEPRPIVHGLGRPRSMSDPNLVTSTDADGLLHVDRPEGWVGAYSPESRKMRIDRFMKKRNHRVWTKKVKYDVRKNFADSRLRVKGRFVKKEDELLMRDLLSLT